VITKQDAKTELFSFYPPHKKHNLLGPQSYTPSVPNKCTSSIQNLFHRKCLGHLALVTIAIFSISKAQYMLIVDIAFDTAMAYICNFVVALVSPLHPGNTLILGQGEYKLQLDLKVYWTQHTFKIEEH
jgi:hypothetical protein